MIEAKRGSSGPRRLQDRTRVLLQGVDFLRARRQAMASMQREVNARNREPHDDPETPLEKFWSCTG